METHQFRGFSTAISRYDTFDQTGSAIRKDSDIGSLEMKPRELFAVLIKVLGVWEVARSLAFIPNTVSVWLDSKAYQYDNPSEFVAMASSMLLSYQVLPIIVGLAMFFGAGWFARKVYPDATTVVAE
jgi:hypothetical protein